MSSDEKPPGGKPAAAKQDGHLLNWYRASVDLVKSAIWPMAVLFLFWSVKAPILSSLAELPAVIRSSQKVTVGTVSIERRLSDAGIPTDVRRALAKLSRDGLVLLLDTGRIGFGYLNAGWEKKDNKASAIQELQHEKLIVIAKTDTGEQYPFQYSLTPSARNAYEVVLRSVITQLAESAAPGGKQ